MSTKKIVDEILFLTCLIILVGCQQRNNKSNEAVILDDIMYEIDNGGIGFDVVDDKSYDTTKPSFITVIHITNNSKSPISLDTSNFKLTDLAGTQVPFKKFADVDVSVLYSQQIEAGNSIDFMLSFAAAKKQHYDLHLISPISKKEKIISF